MVFFFQAEDGIRDIGVTGVQTCALPILPRRLKRSVHTSPQAKARNHYLCNSNRKKEAVSLRILQRGGVASIPRDLSRSARSEERRVGKECRVRRGPGQ